MTNTIKKSVCEFAAEFADDVNSSVMRRGVSGIRDVASKYVFGEKKMMREHFKIEDSSSVTSFFNSFMLNIEEVYISGGTEAVNKYMNEALVHGV